MKKIINTLKYGSWEAKRIIIFAMVAAAFAVGCIIAAIFTGEMLLFFGAVIGFFVAVFQMQTLEIRSEELVEEPPEVKKSPESEHEVLNDTSQEKIVKNVEKNEEKKTKEIKQKKEKVKKEKIKKEKKTKLKNIDSDSVDEVMEERKTEEVPEEVPKEVQEEVSEETTKTEKHAEKVAENKKQIKPISEDELKSYSKQKIKKTMHKYKVKKDHRMVFVDHCEKLNIYQTPAYIWVHDKEFHLLLLESEPRHVIIPLARINEITYLKKHPAHMDVDYAQFKGDSLMTQLFKPYLPDYTFSTVVNDMTAYKNLYGVGPDIYFTNRSAKSLFDFFAVEFNVIDKVTMSSKVNYYFKDAYKANIMLRDNVIDANGYADKISVILDGMAKSTMSYNEFKDTLNLMVRNKLITQEFAMYYMNVRDKNSH